MACRAPPQLGLAFIPYFPLASGVLTGKYRRGEPPPPGTRLSFYDEAVERRGVRPGRRARALRRGAAATRLLELAIGWLLSLAPVASVITGATKPEQIEANVAASSWRLSDEERAAVAAL